MNLCEQLQGGFSRTCKLDWNSKFISEMLIMAFNSKTTLVSLSSSIYHSLSLSLSLSLPLSIKLVIQLHNSSLMFLSAESEAAVQLFVSEFLVSPMHHIESLQPTLCVFLKNVYVSTCCIRIYIYLYILNQHVY